MVPHEDKLAWMQQEIGKDADLPTFAAKFLELFKDKIRDATTQKSKCLKLYAQYVPKDSEARGWGKESDLPPEALEEFQRVWDPSAPYRCRECNRALPITKHYLDSWYCSPKCETACKKISCGLVVERTVAAKETSLPTSLVRDEAYRQGLYVRGS